MGGAFCAGVGSGGGLMERREGEGSLKEAWLGGKSKEEKNKYKTRIIHAWRFSQTPTFPHSNRPLGSPPVPRCVGSM